MLRNSRFLFSILLFNECDRYDISIGYFWGTVFDFLVVALDEFVESDITKGKTFGFSSSFDCGVFAGTHGKEECTDDQLRDGCVKLRVFGLF